MNFFGKFSIEVYNVDTKKKKRVIDNQKNLILNNLFNISSFHYRPVACACLFGTNTAPPQVTDTSITNLQAIYTSQYLGGTTYNRRFEGQKYIHESTLKMTGTQGQLVGNFSEIGVTWGSNANLFTRALIKDDQGAPTTITFGEFDIVTVYYTIGWELTLPADDAPFTTTQVDLGGQLTTVSFHWADYNKNTTTTGVFATGGGATGGIISPAYYLTKIVPFTGTITDFGVVTSQQVAGLHTALNMNTTGATFTADGTKHTYNSRTRVWSEGVATGVWNGLAITDGNNSFLNQEVAANIIAVFDPPVTKGENDVFTLDALTFEFSRGS